MRTTLALSFCVAAGFATLATTPYAAIPESATQVVAVANHGVDDPAGDSRKGRGTDPRYQPASPIVAKQGADDPAGDGRKGRGADPRYQSASPIVVAGGDDPAGDGRRGRGRDPA
jgi:hypothetical protein